jgi:hypothetical protein
MKKKLKDQACKKCGCTKNMFRYDGSWDVLRYTCDRCSYTWTTKPLDKEGK